MIDAHDLIVDCLIKKKTGMTAWLYVNEFVRITHIPTGITVTKHSSLNQTKARDEAISELEILVEIWEEN